MRKIQWKKLLVLAMAMALLGINIKGLADEVTAESRKFSVLSIDGEEAFVNRGGVREVKAAAGMPLGQGSSVRTGSKTSLYFEADDDKTMKLDSNSQAEITQSSSKKLKLTLKSGEMFFNVERPLAEGEELTFRAAQTSMSIRGTSGVLRIHEQGIDFYLIEGKVDWNIGNEVISLVAGQRASLIKQTNVTLSANGMDSAYLLAAVEPFDWTDLSALGLEAVLEQRDKLDLSAIGLDQPEELEEAEKRAAELRKEQDIREEKEEALAKRKAEEAARQAEDSGSRDSDSDEPIRVATPSDPDEPATTEPGTSDGGSSGSETEETTAEETTPEETLPEETLPEETTPEETLPEETLPEETPPEETLPEETLPEETTPEETSPEETPPEETPEESGSEPEYDVIITYSEEKDGTIIYYDTYGNAYHAVTDTEVEYYYAWIDGEGVWVVPVLIATA